MSWRLAKSLDTLRKQINATHPQRSKVSDGTIGDAAHAHRKSDHNRDEDGVVRALDITHDPKAGVDCGKIVEALKASADPRISYIIWNRRIWNPAVSPAWRPYTRANPHNKHFHLSVKGPPLRDDETPWKWQTN